MSQIPLDLSKRKLSSIGTEKRITITYSEEFKDLFDRLANIQGFSVSELGHRYFVEGIQRPSFYFRAAQNPTSLMRNGA